MTKKKILGKNIVYKSVLDVHLPFFWSPFGGTASRKFCPYTYPFLSPFLPISLSNFLILYILFQSLEIHISLICYIYVVSIHLPILLVDITECSQPRHFYKTLQGKDIDWHWTVQWLHVSSFDLLYWLMSLLVLSNWHGRRSQVYQQGFLYKISTVLTTHLMYTVC